MRAKKARRTKRIAAVPRWGWSGVCKKLPFELSETVLQSLVNLLPSRTSSFENFGAELRQMAAAYLRDLHQDEFGPTRAERAQALKAVIEQLDALWPEVEGLAPRPRSLLGEELSACWSPAGLFEINPLNSHTADKDAIEAIATAAANLRHDLSRAGRTDEADALNRLCSTAGRAALLLSILDSTTDGDVILAARSTDSTPVENPADTFAVLGEQMQRLRLRLKRELVRLKRIKGTEPRVSFDLLVSRICDLWFRETGQPVTANPYHHDEYKSRPQSEAGRFVCEVVEALQPSAAWIAGYEALATQRRALMVTSPRGCRDRAVHTAMRAYVAAQKAGGAAPPSAKTYSVSAIGELGGYGSIRSICSQGKPNEPSKPSISPVKWLRRLPGSQSPPRRH
jgi:hypothetical protein